MHKISVIIPCFNADKYIVRCLDSLTQQTYPNLEIICIDDCSTDNTTQTIQDYIATHTGHTIKLLRHQKNGGVSVARNTGLDAATGDYIGFVDADDYIDHDFYAKLYHCITKNDADIAVSNICEHCTDGTTRRRTKWLRNVRRHRHYFNHTIWCALYSAAFLRKHKIYNPVGISNGEDTVFCIQCASYCRRICCVPSTYYHYIRYDGSAESKYYTRHHVNARIKMAHAIVDFINTTDIPKTEYLFHFNKAFRFVYDYVFKRTTDEVLRKESLANAIELYHKCRHREYFNRHPSAYPFIRCNDVDGLYSYQASRHPTPKQRQIKLFKKIPIASIKYEPEIRTLYLLGLPILQIYD